MADETQTVEQQKTFSPPAKTLPKTRRLKLSQQAFVKAIADPEQPTFGNARASYAVSHPRSQSALAQRVAGSRTLAKANVHEAVVEQLQAAGVNLQDEAAWGIATAKARHNLTAHNAYIQTLGTLTGQWKQRSEVTTVADETKDFIRRTVAEKVLTQRTEN